MIDETRLYLFGVDLLHENLARVFVLLVKFDKVTRKETQTDFCALKAAI
jgi:hypothetical protein